MSSAPNKTVELGVKLWKRSQEAENETRQKGLEADKFRAGEQWPRNVKQTRETEMRPCLTFNRMGQFTRQVTNDMRMNRPSLRIDPVGDADVDTAKIFEGLVRHIQVASNADVAYDCAGESAVGKGWGYFRVVTEYVDDESFDQEIKIKRIKNAFTVYYDPDCQEPDYSDAKYCFVVADIERELFKSEYPKAVAGTTDFISTGDTPPDWQTDDYVRVAEWFNVEEKDGCLYLLSNGQTLLTKTKEDGIKAAQAAGLTIQNKRDTKIREVVWRKITWCDELEKSLWPGKYIPIIPVLGNDMDLDGKRLLTGMVYDAMDAQRMYNYWSTAETELIALAPKSPWLIAEGQMEGYETIWQNANTMNYSHLPYKPTSLNGTPVPSPQRIQSEPPINAMIQAIAQADNNMKATTGIYDASLGSRSNETSGKAILARQREGDVSNFHYIDNLSRAIRFLGVQLIDLIPKIYDAPRVVRIIGEDEVAKTVKINQPTGETDANGLEKIYDLTAGKYDVVVNVGPSFSTKRQESADAMISLIQSDPSLMQKAGDLIVNQMDFPMAQELAERLKKTLPPELQEDVNGADVPEPIKAKMMQDGQTIEQLTQALNAAHDQIDQKQAELASKEAIAAQNNQTKLVIEALKQETTASHALLMAELQRIARTEDAARQSQMIDQQTPLTPQG